MDYFAVIDTETNWNNEVMSIGAVIAEKDTFKKVDDLYFIFDPENWRYVFYGASGKRRRT